MQIIRNLKDCNMETRTVVALGNFDGIHIGHREILLGAVRKARSQGLCPVCFTFSNHTRKDVSLICTETEKMEILESLGIEVVVNIPFDEAIRSMPAEDFIRRILRDSLHASFVSCGFNYRFGAGARGDVTLLRQIGAGAGIEAMVHDPVYVDGQVVSSTLVREYIRNGEMERASVCLGRNYYCTGTVVRGNHIGSRIGYPTANIDFEAYRIAPPNGVYVTRTNLDGKKYPSVTDVGVKPTIGEFSKSVETHIYGLHRELYGEPIQVEFLRWERPEKKFPNVEALRAQIAKDYERAKEYHEEHGYLTKSAK